MHKNKNFFKKSGTFLIIIRLILCNLTEINTVRTFYTKNAYILSVISEFVIKINKISLIP